jgi:competence protein ComEA
MNKQQPSRDLSARALEGSSTLSQVRGRSSAPHPSLWTPLATKALLALVGAVVLAFIGARAGAHAPPPDDPILAVTASAHAAPPLAPVPVEPPPQPEVDGGNVPASGVLADGRIILNVASEDELMKLPGIGPSRARAILALRQRLAKFRAVEDLLRVKGIGRKTLRRIKPNVVLDRPAVADSAKQVLRE